MIKETIKQPKKTTAICKKQRRALTIKKRAPELVEN